MKNVAFIVPTTTNKREYTTLNETELYKFLLPSIISLSTDFKIQVFIGYDNDDPLFSRTDLPKFYNNHHNIIQLNWIAVEDMKGKPTHIWNHLADIAIENDFEYLMVLGDDIICDSRKEWLGIFIKELKKNHNIGFSAGWSNNNDIPTQFLIHKTHIDMFGWVYPPLIHNWFCDNWLADIYGKKYGNWLKEYKLINAGGEPRYIPKDDKKLCKMLVHRHTPTINRYINLNLHR